MPTSVSAPVPSHSGTVAPSRISGRPMTSRVAAWPIPHTAPSRVAARVPAPSAATSEVTAIR